MAKKDSKDVITQRDLKNDIELLLKTYATTFCKEAANEAVKFAKYAIEQFYNDYTPKEYVRTNNLKNNSYKRYYHNNGHGYVQGGVTIYSDDMFDNYDGVDPFYVADAGWHGWHGAKGSDFISGNFNNTNFRPIFTTPPLDIVRGKMKEKDF